MFLHTDIISTQGDMHCVNLAQGIKEPIIRYQHDHDKMYIYAVNKGFSEIRKYMGQPQGMYGGDENIRNGNPVNGSELCSAVELMFSLESMLAITGDIGFADHLERIAFNALPAQVNDEFTARQYFQQPNQVMITRHPRNFNVDHQGTDLCFGLLTGYPCCTSNMHQGWPKFTQNLWYATPDGGLAALVYAPNRVSAKVTNGSEITIEEITGYPFNDRIVFEFTLKNGPVNFPLHLRIPEWCNEALVSINGSEYSRTAGDSILILTREWKTGDRVELNLPMKIHLSQWFENSMAVERGPLVYALKIQEKWDMVKNDKDPVRYGNSYFEVRPLTEWNYALINASKDKIQDAYKVITRNDNTAYPWNPENAPVEIKTLAKRIKSWKLYNESAGPLPYSIQYGLETESAKEEITLIPYGCTTLRISEFPVINE